MEYVDVTGWVTWVATAIRMNFRLLIRLKAWLNYRKPPFN
jgi:hypothetical protein